MEACGKPQRSGLSCQHPVLHQMFNPGGRAGGAAGGVGESEGEERGGGGGRGLAAGVAGAGATHSDWRPQEELGVCAIYTHITSPAWIGT